MMLVDFLKVLEFYETLIFLLLLISSQWEH